MRCNSCWRELEGDGRAVATICGHVFCAKDASNITPGSPCPICEQVLSRSHIKPVDLNPSEEWTNMIMAGIPPQNIMKSAFRGVVFWIGQKDVEAQVTVDKALQLKEKYKQMESQYAQKLEQVYEAYQKAMKKVQALELEKQNLHKDIVELQEKYTEKSRQKRKLEEMYESLRNEYERSSKRTSCVSPRPPSAGGIGKLAIGGGFGSNKQHHQTSPFNKTSDSDMFRPPPPPVAKGSNSLRNLLLSPMKRPYRPGLG